MRETLLVILNPRAIPECIDALRDLRGVDKAWLSYYNEQQLETIFPQLINELEYRRIVTISDDTTPTQTALDQVLDLADEYPDAVATGWCNLDAVSDRCTFNPLPLRNSSGPTLDAYSFTSTETARALTEPARTYFHGFALATMSRDLWKRYPFASYNGHASDYHQCVRLQADNVPIYTIGAAEVHHVKETANRLDQAHDKRLLIGERPARVTIELEYATT